MDAYIGQDGRSVANFALDISKHNNISLTNLQLQKVLYFTHAWYLVEFKEPLIKHQFEAWEFGPVMPYVYRAFKEFGDKPITKRATRINAEAAKHEIAKLSLPYEKISWIQSLAEKYIKISASQLVELSHVKEGPWHKVWHNQGNLSPGMKIEHNQIYDYYANLSRSLNMH